MTLYVACKGRKWSAGLLFLTAMLPRT